MDRIIDHPEYSLPDWQWVITTFADALAEDQKRLGIYDYDPNLNNCVDYCLHARSIFNLCNRDTPNAAFHVLFGEVGYMKLQDAVQEEGHRINFTIVNINGVRTLKFFEPQQHRAEVFLIDAELDSVHSYHV